VPEAGQTAVADHVAYIQPQSPPRSRGPWYLASCLALLVTIALTGLLVASRVRHTSPPQALRIVSGSMEPTLSIGAVVRVDSSAYQSAPPQIGDIVAFHAPDGAVSETPACGVTVAAGQACAQSTTGESQRVFVKRVVALPGDTVAIVNGSVVRNGAPQYERVAAGCWGGSVCNLPTPITVPAGEVFLVGDNRETSDDSRSWGPVPITWIVGKVTP